MSKPKAILFDIGGVCVVSPMQAIVDYETQNGLPKDYINFAIARAAPGGAWHRLERGEIKLDDEFFAGFKADLNRQESWDAYHKVFKNRKRTLAATAKAKASQLGDPVSLKAETSSNSPTPEEAGAAPSISLATNARNTDSGNSLKESYQKNMLGDPTSLKNEGSSSEPVAADDQATGYSKGGASDNAAGVGRSSPPANSLKQSYKSNMLGDPTSLKNEGSSSSPLPDQADTGYSKDGSSPGKATSSSPPPPPSSSSAPPSASGNSLKQSYQKNMLGDPTSLKNEGSSSSPLPGQDDTGYSKTDALPPLPTVDSTTLFWDMIGRSRYPDPHMYPALLNLKASRQYIVGALSNTVNFPPDHPWSKDVSDDPRGVRSHFDVFVGSADIGLRKPDHAIYKYAIDKLDRFDRSRGGSGVTAADVCFLDDIGQNLKAAREVGLRTIKVNMGRVDEAVGELEKVTGLRLAGDKAKL